LVKSFDPGSRADVEVTSLNLIVGTPLYMAPEAIGGTAPLDGRCDLYALGAVGYFLLTGAPVFQARTQVEIFAHHLHTPPEPPSFRSGNHVPEGLERLILRCLAKTPGDRYESAKALLHALDKCAENTPWDTELALQWWAAFKSGAAAKPLPTSGPQTIAVDITKRVIRA
jgi:serine/threonine-protein kinase